MKQNKIYIANISFGTNEEAVKTEFSKFGEIECMELIKDRYTGELRGFGFITYRTQYAAESALKLNGELFSGRALRVCMAQTQAKSNSRRRR